MKIGQVMTLEVDVVRPQDGVQIVAEMMRDLDVGMIPVVDHEAVVGIVTDRDIAVRFVAEGLDFSGTSVSDVMSREVFYVYEDEDVEAAAKLMESKQVRRLVVLSRDNKLVGVVSLADLALTQPRAAEPVLERVSEPESRFVPGVDRRVADRRAGSETDALNGLIKDELAAVETYRIALEGLGAPAAAEARRLENDHERAVELLRQKVEERGVEPATRSGAWGGWARFVESAATLAGDKAALKALKEGEEHAIKDYERALESRALSADVRALIQTNLLPQARSHIPALDRFLGGRPPSGSSYNADQGYGDAGQGRGVA